MHIETDRLIITAFTPDMAQAVHINSLDEDTRRFLPDEVFETVEDARRTIEALIACYDGTEGPFVYPVLLKDCGANIGYVQLIPCADGWEIGYHIAKNHTGHGYATEAVKAFLSFIAEKVDTNSISATVLKENTASLHVLEKCGFQTFYTGIGDYQGERREIVRAVLPRQKG